MRNSLTILLLAALGISVFPASSLAQGTYLASNNDLLMRIEQVEAQLASVEQGGGCAEPCEVDFCDSCHSGGWYIYYENVIVQPFFTRNSAYYLEDPPAIDGYLEVPFDWDLTYSPRIEVGRLGDCGCLGWRVRYWHFDADSDLNATDPNGDIFAAFADDSISFIGIDDASEAFFSHSLKMDVVDAEVAFRECNRTYSGGIRYARMEQEYVGVEIAPGTDAFLATHDFDGFGLTTAVELQRPWRGGLSVFAKVRASLLYGESTWRAVNDDEDALLSNNNNDDLLAVGELQLGIDWRTCLGGGQVAFLTLALEGQYWANAGTGGPTNNAPFDEGNYQNANPQDADLGFFGGTIGLGLIY